jgi:hypothetical protein
MALQTQIGNNLPLASVVLVLWLSMIAPVGLA